MDYIFDFTLHIDGLPTDAFRLTYLDSQNDGPSQDVSFMVRCFSRHSYEVSDWGLKKASLYLHEQLLHDGLLVDGKAYEKDFEGYFYEFMLASPFALFKTRGPDRVFVDKTVDEIINIVFKSAGWTSKHWHWQLKQPLPVLAYRVQYHQADYDFIMELMAEFNLHFEFKNSLCILSDNLSIKTTTHHVEEPQPYIKKTSPEFMGYHFEKAFNPDTFFATIEAPDEQEPYLNQDGHYRMRWDFDKTSAPLEGSSPIPLISPHFMHFPLRKDTRVAVRCLEGKMHQPVLIGVMPVIEPKSGKYIHQSYSEHKFGLDADKILICHGNEKNYLTVSKNTTLVSEEGSIVFHAANNLQRDIEQNHENTIGNNVTLTVKENCHIETNTMQISAGGNSSYSAEQKFLLNASESIDSKNQLSQFFAEDINMVSNQTIKIAAQKNITVFGQECSMKLSSAELQAGAGITLTEGNIMFNTPVLSINAAVISGI